MRAVLRRPGRGGPHASHETRGVQPSGHGQLNLSNRRRLGKRKMIVVRRNRNLGLLLPPGKLSGRIRRSWSSRSPTRSSWSRRRPRNRGDSRWNTGSPRAGRRGRRHSSCRQGNIPPLVRSRVAGSSPIRRPDSRGGNPEHSHPGPEKPAPCAMLGLTNAPRSSAVTTRPRSAPLHCFDFMFVSRSDARVRRSRPTRRGAHQTPSKRENERHR